MQHSVTQSQPVVKKVAKVSKRTTDQRIVREVNYGVTIEQMEAHGKYIADQLAQFDDVLFA